MVHSGRLGRLIGLLLLSGWVCSAGANGYLGSDVCAGCHKDIAKTQAQTNMARTWQGVDTKQLPPNYSATHAEGPEPAIHYQVQRTDDKAEYRVQMAGDAPVELPVETTVGGKRHAITFILRVEEFKGSKLPRAPLVEGRYIHSVLENGLALELGFPEDKPVNYETALGRVLTPTLEARCFSCHVAPRKLGTRVETGVACENCHGPGQAHLIALSTHSKDLGILNPDKLPVEEQMRPCSQCHAGSAPFEDALFDNLLISNQVTSLKHSECWRQSEGQITCTNCHNPHQDAARAVLVSRGEATCLRCHSLKAANHAGICPVNRVNGCIGCHMPVQIHGAFHLATHWIGVHTEQKVKVGARDPALKTTVTPKHMFLRAIVMEDRDKAEAVRRQIVAGGPFFDLAQANSMDAATRTYGGYLGDLSASQINPKWAEKVLKLQPGEVCELIEQDGKYFIIQRMPRSFREEAEVKVNEAEKLRKEGKLSDSVAALFDSLKTYPYFLRAMTYLGIIYSQSGKPQVGAQMLEMATRLYPNDEGAHFNLGIAYGALGKEEEIAEYKRTLEIDEDYAPAYLNWGAALFAKGQVDDAIALYRKGININPLDSSLHYSLSIALDRLNKKQEAAEEAALAAKIDPKYAAH